jgi:hypothetical protein
MTTLHMVEMADPVATFDGGMNCSKCHRPVTLRVIARSDPDGADTVLYVHTADYGRACTR